MFGCRRPVTREITVSATPTVMPSPGPDTALERRVFYYPDNEVRGAVPTGVETVKFETSDGIELVAWYLPPPDRAPLVVYFHGNGGNLSSLGSVVADYEEAGCGLLAVDYRGFGDSQGEPSEEGLYLDGLATYDFARKNHPERPIILHGRSLGGGVASFVATERECKKLILESTFTSTKELARHSHGDKAARLIDGFDTLARADAIEGPVLLVHGTSDETVPFFMGQDLLNALGSKATLWEVKGAGHNTVRRTAGDELVARLKLFIHESTEP
jgi:fermentation-respiration switch protein FrsA (DUF1100 family)